MTLIYCPKCAAEIPSGFKFCGACGAKLEAQESTASALAAKSNADWAPRDEFRDVTILFADVSGFTAMAERLDPEVLRETMNACFEGLGRIVQSHGGHVDKYIGDSIMALFGAPIAHEDDPVRAAEAALAMQAFLAEFSTRRSEGKHGGTPQFRMRIGMNCGLVVAGAVGSGVRRDYSVMGDAVNIASRLESAAAPGTILVSADLKRRVDRHFSFGPSRILQLKGKDRPIEAFILECDQNASVEPGQPDVEPFVGRLRELRRIHRALSKAGKSWVEVRGPVGVGKTRLIDVALKREPQFRVVRAASRPTTAARPFALLRRLLQSLLMTQSGLRSAPRSSGDFVTQLGVLGDGLDAYVSAIWYIAANDVLNVKSPDPDPLTLRRTIEEGITRLLANAAKHDPPFLLFLDDYHLADAETRDLLERQVNNRVHSTPAIVTTVRLEALPVECATEVLDLAGVETQEAFELVRKLTADSPLAEKIGHDIVLRACGVPLFIKELVRKVQDEEGSSGAQATVLPSSLLGVLISRLDLLDSRTRDYLAQCAVQGAEFSSSIALDIWIARGGQNDEAGKLNDELARKHFIVEVDADQARWSFAQILMQNACYDQLLRRERREIHRLVANALVTSADGEQGVSPVILADHYENAELWSLAARQNVRAGDRAAELFANSEALARYARAIKGLDEAVLIGDMEATTHVGACQGAARVHLRIGDYANLQAAATRMLEIAVTPADRAEAIRLMSQGHLHTGELDTANRLLAQAAELVGDAESTGPHREVAGRLAYDRADVSYRLGQNDGASQHITIGRLHSRAYPAEIIRLDILEGRLEHTRGQFERASALYEKAHKAARSAGSLSEEALTSNYMGNAARDSGYYQDAEAYFLRALQIWTQIGMTEAIAGAHNNLANLAISRGDPTEASRHYLDALNAFEKIGNLSGRATALINLAIVAIENGEPDAALSNADTACRILESSGNKVLLGLADVIKGEALIEAGRHAQALSVFDMVIAVHSETTHPLALAGAFRGIGRVRLHEGHLSEAAQALEQSLVLFERLRRVQEAARTQLYLACTLEQMGRSAEAEKRFEHARRRFLEIGAARDLERAEALCREHHGRRSANPVSS